ncbi:MAG: hypothetical protein ACP5XB_31875 [Isosphaeraceae bacterium]
MQVRSWMAALVLVAGTTGSRVVDVQAQSPAPSRSPESQAKQPENQATAQPADESPECPGCHSVRLNLRVAGLGRAGCEVDVKPANHSCRFRPQTIHVGSAGVAALLFRDVELRGADRNCMFSVTLREPGQDSRTVYRGLRITARGDEAASKRVESLTCFMNSRSKLAGLDRPDRTRR